MKARIASGLRQLFPLLLLSCGAWLDAPSASAYDFAYRVQGDRRVAPVQVFDDSRDTYVQFRAGQTVPAIFRVDAGGEHLAEYRVNGSYVVVPGVFRQLTMRIGEVAAAAHYQGAAPRSMPASQGTGEAPLDVVQAGFAPAGFPSIEAPRRPAPSVPAARDGFHAALADRNMRTLLERWAHDAGWVFKPEHWAVDVDIPLAGTASFDGDFKSAVRQLLASTELSARPVQPCFYSNRVLRVVPLVESCNRARAVTASR